MTFRIDPLPGYEVGQLRLIFCGAEDFQSARARGGQPTMFAYYERMILGPRIDAATQFFPVDRSPTRACIVAPLEQVVQPCPLTPRFGEHASELNVTNDNCLDTCDRFFVNSFHSKHNHQTVY